MIGTIPVDAEPLSDANTFCLVDDRVCRCNVGLSAAAVTYAGGRGVFITSLCQYVTYITCSSGERQQQRDTYRLYIELRYTRTAEPKHKPSY